MVGNNTLVPRIGFEIHIQVKAKRKAFAPEGYEFGAEPNTFISPVSMGHPGTLPVPNIALVKNCIMIGIATHCNIAPKVVFYRKNYFYPDLPKGYQISQYKVPLCSEGYVIINNKKIRIKEIHIEEDTGKSIHDLHPHHSLIDFNRAGVCLIEMVTYPDIASVEEATEFVRYVRRLVRYLGISDGNMEEGNLRCDTNISIFDEATGTQYPKVEIKNLNSMQNIAMALDYEIKRQTELIENGGAPERETRGFSAEKKKTYPMRTKEYAHDYRYFPEPDIPPILISENFIEEVKREMGELPEDKIKRYISLGIKERDAYIIAEEPDFSNYFDEVLKHTRYIDIAVYLCLGPLRNLINNNTISIKDIKIPPCHVGQLSNLVGEGKVAKFVASQDIFEEMLKNPQLTPEEIATKMGKIIGTKDTDELISLIDSIIAAYPEKVIEYKRGKKGIVGMIMGELNRRARGKFDPRLASTLIQKKLDEIEPKM